MKKSLILLLFFLVVLVSYLIYDEFSFSPLSKSDFRQLVKEGNVSFNKTCSEDFIGTSIHGEVFDFYTYKTNKVAIEKDYPMITKWEHQKVTSATIIGKWRNCPIDAQTASLFEASMLMVKNLNEAKCNDSFKNDLVNPNNYYSYVYFSASEKYFLLYSSNRQELYYVRLKGL